MADFLNVEFSKDCPGSSAIATEPMLSSYIMTPKDGDEDSKSLMYIENLSSINNLYSTSSGLSIENDLQEVSMVPSNGVVSNSLIQFLPNGDQEVTDIEDSSQLLKNDSPYYSYLRLPPSSSAQDDHGIQIYTTSNSGTQPASQEKNELSDEMILRFVNNPKSLKQQKSPTTTSKTKINNNSTYEDVENFSDNDTNTNNLVYGEDGPDEVGDYINHEQPSCSTGQQLDDVLQSTTTTKKQQQVVIVTQDSAVKSSSKSPHHNIEDQQQQVGEKSPDSDEQVEFEIVTVDLLLSDEANLEEETELEPMEQTISKTAPLRVEISSRRKKTNVCVNKQQQQQEEEVNETATSATKSSPQYKGAKRKNLLTDMQNEAESPRSKKQRTSPIETVAKPFKCSKCHLKFAEEDIFEVHEKCHVEDGKSFHCCYANCKVKFPNWVKMYHHLFKHGLRKPYKCNECSFTCISRSDLTTHAYVHAQVKSWKCDKCRRTFKHRRNLLAHERQCRGLSSSGKPLVDENLKYKCPDCDKQLANKRNLDKHREIHTNVKPFVCHICGHSTRLKESLIMHKRLHTGEKPFKCDKCDYSTPDKSSLRRHKRRHNNDKPYKCNQCDYSCIQKHCLDTHIRRAHTGEQFMCEFCRYVTPNRYALNQHRKRHNIKLYHTNGNGQPTVIRCLSDVIPSFSNNNTTSGGGSAGKPVVIQLDVDQSINPATYRQSSTTRKIRSSDVQQVSQSSNKSINELVEEGAQQQQQQESSSTTQPEEMKVADETVIVVSDNYDIVTQNDDDGSQDYVLSPQDVEFIAAELEKQQDDPQKNNGDTQEVWIPRRDGRMIVIQFGGASEDEQATTTTTTTPPSITTTNSYQQLTYQQKRS